MWGLSTHQVVLCDTSWVSYNWVQFWHSPPGDSIRSHRLKSLSHKTSTPQLQMPVTSPTSFTLLTTWLSVGIPTTHLVGLTIYSNDPQKSGKHIYQYIISLFNPINHKGNHTWIFIGRTDAEGEAPILWPPDAKSWLFPWCWERLMGGEGDNRGWDGGMVPATQWNWIWAGSRRWWWTGKPGVLQSMGSQSVRHDRWAEQQQQAEDLGKLHQDSWSRETVV